MDGFPVIFRVCHGNGECDRQGKCQCYAGYTGDACENAPPDLGPLLLGFVVFVLGVCCCCSAYVYYLRRKMRFSERERKRKQEEEAKNAAKLAQVRKAGAVAAAKIRPVIEALVRGEGEASEVKRVGRRQELQLLSMTPAEMKVKLSSKVWNKFAR